MSVNRRQEEANSAAAAGEAEPAGRQGEASWQCWRGGGLGRPRVRAPGARARSSRGGAGRGRTLRGGLGGLDQARHGAPEGLVGEAHEGQRAPLVLGGEDALQAGGLGVGWGVGLLRCSAAGAGSCKQRGCSMQVCAEDGPRPGARVMGEAQPALTLRRTMAASVCSSSTPWMVVAAARAATAMPYDRLPGFMLRGAGARRRAP
jgi:hypothetical protein